jgi:2-polyprenyl-6-hydroxyphenyl methylase/3-demethylubiquinone-9 3-methyltransferase
MTKISTIDAAEVAKFEAMAAEWWDANGKFKPLHLMNPCRLSYITGQIAAQFDRDLTAPLPFAGLRILDIGCGGGLLPAARRGATARMPPPTPLLPGRPTLKAKSPDAS